MKRIKRTNLTVQTERLLVVSHSHPSAAHWCEGCGARVRMIGIEEAALVADLSQRAIFRYIEDGRIHFAETDDGSLLVCVDSILNQSSP